MEYINNNTTLCLTYNEYVGYFGLETYKSDKKRKLITVHGTGGNGRKVLIEYETLQPKRKDVIKAKIGSPYEYMAKQPILDLIDWDMTAQQFYTDYVLPNGLQLPATDLDAKGKPQINYVKRYTKAASWLNMITRLTNDKRELKRSLNLSVMEFWEIVSELIRKEKIDIPTARTRLVEKLAQYNAFSNDADRYEFLIEKHRFGNNNAGKVTDEQSQALLFALFKDGRKHDDNVIAAAYNVQAKKEGWPTISANTVTYFYNKNKHIIDPAREGMKKSYTKYVKQIQRERASAPLFYVNADDNNLDLFFEVEREKDGKITKSKYYRPVLYIISDTFNDYILGYAIGDVVNKELVFAAWRNAIEHIYELTGGYYLPLQLQTDRWGLDAKLKNDLAQFHQMVGNKFTVQSHGLPQGKYIERSFGDEWHQVLKALPSNNYAGKNITAKERLSLEHITNAAKLHPSIENMPAIVHQFITLMRLKGNPKTKVSRQKEWIDAFMASEKSKKRRIDTSLKLDMVGVKRVGEPLKITSAGLQFSLNKQLFVLDVPEMVIYEHNGKKVDVIYNPAKLDEFLVTDNKGLRFVCGLYEKRKGAIADYTEGSRLQIEQDFAAKKRITNLMANVIEERTKALGDINPQSLIQAGILTKDLKNEAEAAYLEGIFNTPLIESKRELPAPPVQPQLPASDNDELDFYNLL